MAKLTLNDITGGYQTATAYNANNALMEAALENTLSLDGTTPNQMAANIDLNSNSLINVDDVLATGQITAGSFILNGTVITSTTTLTGGLDATEVAFTPTNPAGALTTLQDALDDDYLRNDRNETITGTLDVSGALTVASGGITVDAGTLTLTNGDLTLTAGNLVVSGTVDGRDVAVDGAALDVVEATVADDQPGNYSAGNDMDATVEAGDGTNTATYGEQRGEWTQIGNVVFFTLEIHLSALGDMTIGANSVRVVLNGAPSTDVPGAAFPVMSQNNTIAATDSLVAYIDGTNNQLIIQNYTETQGCTPMTTSQLNATSSFHIAGSYFTSSTP